MRILVVEDEQDLAETMRRGLEAEGYEVGLAATGLEGLWSARTGGYDAMVLDLLLPQMSGFTVCKTLREDHNQIPILVLTAKDGEHDEAEALDTGADDFLRKPFSFVVLLARLRALLRRGSAPMPEGAVLEVGDLTIDTASRRCLLAGREISLSPRELAVLQHLAVRAGEVVSKRELIDHVWGFDFEGDPNIVEVYVSYLRKKIDRPFGRTTIRTVRGFGYRLSAGE